MGARERSRNMKGCKGCKIHERLGGLYGMRMKTAAFSEAPGSFPPLLSAL